MRELFYFSGFDLMIKVEYSKATNSLCYASHREMEYDESVMAAQYLMVQIAPQADSQFRFPAKLVYLGTDKRLEEKLINFQTKNESKLSRKEENKITESVNNLISISMRSYYTEKIGELIISLRNEVKEGRHDEWRLVNLRAQMQDLLRAYNVHSERKITLTEILPRELKSHWKNLEEASC